MDILQQRILEIAMQIPGYLGYEAKDRRRDMDKYTRGQLAGKYGEMSTSLARVQKKAPLAHIVDLENLDQKLQRLIARPATDPKIIVAVDEPRAAVLPQLRAIIQRGAAVGVHCIIAAREPLDLPVNVKITADRQPGDFWADAARSGAVIRFDAAHIATHEIGSFIQSLK